MTRIRNWKDLTFYRSSADARYAHIGSLFGDPGENTINWPLIETHWRDVMQVVLLIREGRLSSTLLLRRLGTEWRKNNVYKAFRELGRVIRTITLLRFTSEPELREEITAATNKVEAYQGFSAWLRFGYEAIERNDPAAQEKIIKFNTLLANCVIFHTALDMTAVLRQLAREGWPSRPLQSPPCRRTSPSRSSASASTPPTASPTHPPHSTHTSTSATRFSATRPQPSKPREDHTRAARREDSPRSKPPPGVELGVRDGPHAAGRFTPASHVRPECRISRARGRVRRRARRLPLFVQHGSATSA